MPTPESPSTPAPPTRPPHRDLVGAWVDDRFLVTRLIGEGGIGRVYAARQEALDREVALKVLRPELSQHGEVLERFRREAQAASRLQHHGSVMVFDFGTWNDVLYLAMELVDGPPLSEIIAHEWPLPVARIIDISAQICDALAAAHEEGLLHRDLKPDNVLISKGLNGQDVVKVCDYGLAFIFGDEAADRTRITREGTIAGTPCYMAPEQIVNQEQDPRTDVYAIGCLLYELMTQEPPFTGDSAMEVMTKQLYDEPKRPSLRARREFPQALEDAVLWALRKAKDERPASAMELKEAILRASGAPTGSSRRPTLEEPYPTRRSRVIDANLGHADTATSLAVAVSEAHTVLVVEPEGTPFNRSAAMVLRAQGAHVRVMSELQPQSASGVDALVLDARANPLAGVRMLAHARDAWRGAALLILGSNDAFEAMTEALELKVIDYVPEKMLTALPRKLDKAVRKLQRSARGVPAERPAATEPDGGRLEPGKPQQR